MTDERTVLDVLVEANLATHIFEADDGINSISVHTKIEAATYATDALDIDPAMPFEQFARWLRYGKNADRITEADFDDLDHSEYWGYRRCLRDIKGDDA